MIVRRLNPSDIDELRRIHEKFFSKEFSFSDLFGNSLSSLVVTDDEGKIITGGQVRVIAEACIITDKDIKVEERRRAFHQILNHFKFSVASTKGFNQLHVFSEDDKWIRHLKQAGFEETSGKSLVLNI